ncbi:hypothetical protein GMW39_00780 [Pectobacterium parmentieri]|uniref:hypothetical protein n=1 Tax=Pectobacterium parmentieri TaxID=1905730 RepID=UPI001373C618|nr:hypothetical protein [Pectobacterium parmentieri]QHQ14543.1 hypothetical protein GMW39_00780 [Pectobacterium parmentieri]QQA77033.1 hypothetical protein JBL47_05370 [Pectobacterium parmentieri]
MKNTIAVICADGLFTGEPSISGSEDIINYILTRDSFSRPEDADGETVKHYAITCTVTVEEIK